MSGRAAAPLRVGVNLLWLVPGVVGGSEEYTVRVLAALADERPDDLDVRLYVNSAFPSAYPDLVTRFATTVAPVSGASRLRRVAAESTWLAAACRRDRRQVVHHGGGTLPVVAPGRTLVTVHDLQPFAMPEHFSWPKRVYLHRAMPRTVRRADRLATLSEWVALDTATRLDVPPGHFVRVPPGVRAVETLPEATRAEVWARYGLAGPDGGPRPFFVYPAITYSHKNHLTLVHAFAVLHRRHPDAVLVLPGGAAQRESLVHRTVARLGLGEVVRRTGRIPRADLDALYADATALLFPSRYEGCGIPVLEAMAAGCPVVASDATGLPETVAGAGLLVPPLDVDGWADAAASLLEDPARREALAEAGRARAASFSWSRSAAALAEAYRATAAARR